jgi:hypothetical protein
MSFPDRNIEKARVESGDILVKEVATLGVDSFLCLGIRVIE